MSTPKEIEDPSLRKMWQEAKKAAGVKAKAKKQEPAFGDFCKQFNLDLGPSVKKWPGHYPNLGKMQAEKTKIELVITKYEKLIKIGKGTLDKTVFTVLSQGLTDQRQHLANRMAIAESMLMGNEELALKQAIKESKKKPLKPVVVFNSTDLSGAIMAMAPKAVPIVEINELLIQVVLADDKVLSKVDDNDGNLAQKIKDAANFTQLKKDIARAYVIAAGTIKGDDGKFNAANTAFEGAVNTAIQEATGRASAEMNRIAGVSVEYRNYKIKAGVQLAVTVAGTAAGAASLVMAPFTGPAMIITAVGIAKGASSIGVQIAELSMSAQEMINALNRDVKILNKRYAEWKGAGIGSAEVASTLLNAISPTFVVTIKDCAGQSGTIGSKINGIETKAGQMSVKLNETLDAQQKVDANIKGWIASNKQAVTGDVQKSAVKLMTAMKQNRDMVTKLITKITNMNAQVIKARADLDTLDQKIKILSGREPTAAKFAEVFVEIGASVAFLTAANVGWPDAYDVAKTAKGVTDMIGNVVGSLDGAYAAAVEMQGFVEDLRS